MPTREEKIPPLTFHHLLLLDKLCENIGLQAWQLELEPPPVREIPAGAAAEMVVARMKR
jgi:hypothetical protein